MRVFLIAAVTADGYIARTSDHPADWTSAEDKKLFVELTKEAGVMVMGSHTYATIGKALPGRRSIVYTSKPELISAEGIETTSEEPAALLRRLHSEGASGVAIIGGAAIYDIFMRNGLIDEIYLTIEPLMFGKGLSLFSSELDVRLTLKELRNLNEQTILLHYAVSKKQ